MGSWGGHQKKEYGIPQHEDLGKYSAPLGI